MSSFDAKKNFKQKMKNWELIKEAVKLVPGNKTARKLLKQASDDLKVAKELMKEENKQ